MMSICKWAIIYGKCQASVSPIWNTHQSSRPVRSVHRIQPHKLQLFQFFIFFFCPTWSESFASLGSFWIRGLRIQTFMPLDDFQPARVKTCSTAAWGPSAKIGLWCQVSTWNTMNSIHTINLYESDGNGVSNISQKYTWLLHDLFHFRASTSSDLWLKKPWLNKKPA